MGEYDDEVKEMLGQEAWDVVLGAVRNGHIESQKMEDIGLMPSDTGKAGGAYTGKHMSDYPLANGVFINECQHLIKEKQFSMT